MRLRRETVVRGCAREKHSLCSRTAHTHTHTISSLVLAPKTTHRPTRTGLKAEKRGTCTHARKTIPGKVTAKRVGMRVVVETERERERSKQTAPGFAIYLLLFICYIKINKANFTVQPPTLNRALVRRVVRVRQQFGCRFFPRRDLAVFFREDSPSLPIACGCGPARRLAAESNF